MKHVQKEEIPILEEPTKSLQLLDSVVMNLLLAHNSPFDRSSERPQPYQLHPLCTHQTFTYQGCPSEAEEQFQPLTVPKDLWMSTIW